MAMRIFYWLPDTDIIVAVVIYFINTMFSSGRMVLKIIVPQVVGQHKLWVLAV